MYFRNYIRRRKIKIVQLADIIVSDMNIKRNDIVMVNCSLSHITLSDSKPEDLIHLLKMIVGTKGTLLMPVYSKNHPGAGSGIDIQGANIYNDLVYELFRQMPDTFQSSNSAEPFAVWGSMAKEIAEDHSEGGNEIEPKDLLYKLCQMKAKIIGIGVPLTDNLFQHLISKANSKESTRRHYDEISKNFKDEELKIFTKRGIPFYMVRAEKADEILKETACIS